MTTSIKEIASKKKTKELNKKNEIKFKLTSDSVFCVDAKHMYPENIISSQSMQTLFFHFCLPNRQPGKHTYTAYIHTYIHRNKTTRTTKKVN